MKIGVVGLWHLGSVTAACLARAGFDVVGFDDAQRVAELAKGRAPLFEPGLDELIGTGLVAGKLRFAAVSAKPLREVDLLWVTYDTPVDDDDRADVDDVVSRTVPLLPHLRDGATVLVSSQLPVGTTRGMRDAFAAAHPGRDVLFAYSPENLRLGKAIEAFVNAERIVVGCETPSARTRLEPILGVLGRPLIWMGLESAEMVKHTINALLATSVTFINEVASICERVGAHAGEVEAGIRSEPRIGPRAYVTPGAAFGGGTLARDVAFLSELAARNGLAAPIINAILPSNQDHAQWAFRRVLELLGRGGEAPLQGISAGVLGLTYKPNTSTLRRSTSIELCRRLHAAGARVRAFDPAVGTLPGELAGLFSAERSIEDAVAGADVVIIATAWSEFMAIEAEMLASAMRGRLVLDGGGCVAGNLQEAPGLSYFRIGRAG